MKRPSPTLFSKLVRLVPVLLLIVAVATAPAWGAVQKHEAQDAQAKACCHSQSVDPNQQSSDQGDDGCCGKDCRGCLCPCAKLVLISGLRLAPTSTSVASVLPNLVLSALSLGDADPIFHPPRA